MRKEDQDPFAEAGTAEPSLPLAIIAIAIEELVFMEYRAILGDTEKCPNVTVFQVVNPCASPLVAQGTVLHDVLLATSRCS